VTKIFTIKDQNQKDSSDVFIILSLEESTRIIDTSEGGLKEVMPES
jgi:hypothetical protein